MKKNKHQQVADLVAAAYASSTQPFAQWMWTHHLQAVAQRAQELALRFAADVDLAVVGAWLHDFGDAFVKRHDPTHEQVSRTEAVRVLQQAGFTAAEVEQIIEQVIAPHSCYPDALPQTLEGQALATADALAHLTTDFYLHFAWLNLPDDSTYPQFVLWANQKMDRDFHDKIFFAAVKTETAPRYAALKEIFAIESVLEPLFQPYISKCRAGDWQHARRVAIWARQLGVGRRDLELLLVAAYLHDIGWSGIVPTEVKLTREQLLQLQPQADQQTDSLVKQATAQLNLEAADLEKILRLIKATETYQAQADDEAILVDADNLSKTDPDHVREKYAPSDWLNMLDTFEDKLPERISTQLGKQLFPDKLKKLRQTLSEELRQM